MSAASLVAAGGWDALTTRACENHAEKKRNAFREISIETMRCFVVEAAISEIVEALAKVESDPAATRKDVYFALASHLTTDKQAARLMTQVAALLAATELDDAMSSFISTARSNLLDFLQNIFRGVEEGEIAWQSDVRASALLKWYYAAAVTCVTSPGIDRNELFDLAAPGAIWR